jgi:hypothetical protein
MALIRAAHQKAVIDRGAAAHFGSVEWHARILTIVLKAGTGALS